LLADDVDVRDHMRVPFLYGNGDVRGNGDVDVVAVAVAVVAAAADVAVVAANVAAAANVDVGGGRLKLLLVGALLLQGQQHFA